MANDQSSSDLRRQRDAYGNPRKRLGKNMTSVSMSTKAVVMTDIGGRRSMEDTFVDASIANGAYSLYAVLDGHGGANVAAYCARALPQTVEAALTMRRRRFPPGSEPFEDMGKVLVSAIESLHSKLRGGEAGDADGVGTTLLAVVISREQPSRGRAWIANVGDCRCVLHDEVDGAVQLTRDHSADDERERSRISSAGGHVFSMIGDVPRVMGVLAVARSLGDLELTPFVTHRPEVMTMDLAPDRYKTLVVASDGIWGHVSTEDAVGQLVWHGASKDNAQAATDLIGLARRRGSTDNITVMILDLSSGRARA
jgi:protein phosphatase 1L